MNKDTKISVNGKATANLNHFSEIKIDFDSAVPIRAGNLNSYGLDITNPNFINYQHNNLQLEIIGGVNLLLLNKFQVTLKISKRPQMSAMQVHYNTLDLYNDGAINHYIKEASRKLSVDNPTIAEAVYDLIGRLEEYRKDQLTEKEETFAINSPQPKEAKKVADVLKSENLIKELEKKMKQVGVPDVATAMQLFILGLSAKTKDVIHSVLQGSPMITNEIIKAQIPLLPQEHTRAITSLTDNSLFYVPTKDYWKHKMMVLPSLDTLSKKHNSLIELVTQGELNRFVTQADHTGIYKSSIKQVNGPVCLITATNKGYNNIFQSEDVLQIELLHQTTIKTAISTQRIQTHAGVINPDKEHEAQEFCKHIYRAIEPVQVVNTYLDQLNLQELFNYDTYQIDFFLKITQLITMLHQKQLGRKKQNGVEQVEVKPEHMKIALELFKNIFIKEEDALPFQVARTFDYIKKQLKKQQPKVPKRPKTPIIPQEQQFQLKTIRPKLKMSPPTLQRHLNTLVDYNRLERTGNRKEGYSYQVISWDEATTSAERYNNFMNQINSL